MLPSALACGGDRYDGSEELKAIERALRGNSLPIATRRRVEELFKMASLPTQSLALKGLLLQSEIRGEALKELGLERIPARPALEFETIDKGMSQPALDRDLAQKARTLRIEAEKDWEAGDYAAAQTAIRQALSALNISVRYPRC